MKTVALLSFLFLQCWCGATDSPADVRMELYATHHAVGIEVAYTGDDNNNLQAWFYYRLRGQSAWQEGHEMSFVRERKRIYASAFRFQQGQSVEVKVMLTDPDNRDTTTLTGSATTKRLVVDNKTSRKKYVSPLGNDAGPGTKSQPFKTINRAVQNLQAGDEVIIGAGVYREEITLNKVIGTADKPIIIRGTSSKKATAENLRWFGKHSTPDFPVLTSLQTFPQKPQWTPIEQDIYATPLADLKLNNRMGGYVTMDGKQLFGYRDLAMLKEALRDNMPPDKRGYAVELGITKKIRGDTLEALPAWTYDTVAKTFYVRMAPGGKPDGHRFAYASLSHGFLLNDCRNLVIRDLEIGYFGSHGIRLTGESDSNTLYNNVVHHNPDGILMVGDEEGRQRMDANTVWGNNVFNYGFWQYTWRAMMTVRTGYNGINIVNCGRGNAVIGNSVHNVFNGVNVNAGSAKESFVDANRDFDLLDNLCYNIGDDSWEPDGGGINMRIFNNRSINALELISLAPVKQGPVYVIGNVGLARNYSFKFNNVAHSPGHVYLYHNTGVSIGRGTKAFQFPPASFVFENKVAKNNIFVFSSEASTGLRHGFVFDYNCYFRYGGDTAVTFLHTDLGKNFSLAALRTQTGNEAHGIAGEPGMRSGIAITDEDIIKAYQTDALMPFDFGLKPGSICVDKGVVVKGIGRPFSGKAPDVGAEEYK